MIVLLHIAISLLSIGYSTYLFVAPSRPKLHLMYGMVGLTLLSGIYLVATRPVHILQVCTSGLLYLGFVSVGIVYAHGRLAQAKEK